MKRFFVVLVAVALFLNLVIATGYAAEVVLKLGHIRDLKHPTQKAALKFQELVKKYSDGRIQIKVFPNSQLGGPKEMFTQLQSGDLEMVYGGINTMAWIGGGEPYEITSMPFLYRDYDHMRRALLADFFKPVQAQVEQATKIKIVNINGDTAPRGLSTKARPIRHVNDFKGLKIRTAASETAQRLWKRLGALPQQIPYAELYMALKTGVVEAQENGALVVATKKFYEVQDYYVKTDYVRDIETFYMSMVHWNKLSADDRKIIFRASEEAGKYGTEQTLKVIENSYKVLNEKMKVITEPELDIESIRQSVMGIFDDWDGTKWPKGLMQNIRDLK
jgi:tripartite ATP-independent transporter DctP family solute receptor